MREKIFFKQSKVIIKSEVQKFKFMYDVKCYCI